MKRLKNILLVYGQGVGIHADGLLKNEEMTAWVEEVFDNNLPPQK